MQPSSNIKDYFPHIPPEARFEPLAFAARVLDQAAAAALNNNDGFEVVYRLIGYQAKGAKVVITWTAMGDMAEGNLILTKPQGETQRRSFDVPSEHVQTLHALLDKAQFFEKPRKLPTVCERDGSSWAFEALKLDGQKTYSVWTGFGLKRESDFHKVVGLFLTAAQIELSPLY